MELVTDQKILDKLNEGESNATSSFSSGMTPVTDKKILSQLNEGQQPGQQDDEGLPFLNIGAGLASNVVNPLSDVGNLVGKLLPQSMQPNFQHVENLPFLKNVINPQSVAFKAGEFAPLVTGLGAAGEAIGSTALKAITPVKQVSNTVAQYASKLLGDTPLQAVPSRIAEMLRNAHANVQANVANKYDAIKQMAEQAGFNEDRLPASVLQEQLNLINPSSTISGLPKYPETPKLTGKLINPKQALPFLEQVAAESKSSKDLKNSIADFMANPSYDNAHNLQMNLGYEGASFKTAKDPVDKKIGELMHQAREFFVKDMKNSFVESGNKNIADAYGEASDYFRDNVIPYREIPFLKTAIKSKNTAGTLPSNIMKDDPRLGNILDQLNQYSPESKNLLIANALSKGSGLKHDLNGDIMVDKVNALQDNINDLKNLYTGGSENLKNNLSKIFMASGDRNHGKDLLNILDAYSRAEKIKGRIKKATGFGLAEQIPFVGRILQRAE